MEFEFGLNLDCVDMQITAGFKLLSNCGPSASTLFHGCSVFRCCLTAGDSSWPAASNIILDVPSKWFCITCAIYTSGPQHSLAMPGGGSKIRSGSVSLSDTTTTRLSKR